MEFFPWYEDAFNYIESNYRGDTIKTVSGMEVLIDFLLEVKPNDFLDLALDFSSEESADLYARECIEDFEGWLKANKNEYVRVGRRHRWKVQVEGDVFDSSGEQLRRTRVIDYGLAFNPEEKAVLNKPVVDLLQNDKDALRSLYEKALGAGDLNLDLISDLSFRVATVLELSNVSYIEKARGWIDCGDREFAANNTKSYKRYIQAALKYAINLNHLESAKTYQKAIQAYLHFYKELGKRIDIHLELIRSARRQYDLSGEDREAAELYIQERDLELENSPFVLKLPLFVYKVVSNYGESPGRVILWALGVIVVCASIYFFAGLYSTGSYFVDTKGSSVSKTIHFSSVGRLDSLGISLYYSVVTFTTLGYGDFSPSDPYVRAVSSIQAVLGLLLTSLFMVTVVRKYSR